MSNIREDRSALMSIIQDLGSTISGMLPMEWDQAVMGYFLAGEDLVPHLQLQVRTPEDQDYLDIQEASWEEDAYDAGLLSLQRSCKKLHDLCVKAGDDWKSVTLTLSASGSFRVDWGYDPIVRYDMNFILNWQSTFLL